MTLKELGWSDPLAAALAGRAEPGWTPARVTLELKGFFEVTDASGARLGECTGRFINEATTAAAYPAIGDWVAVTPRPGDATRADIHAVLPRRTKFSRKAAGDQTVEQVIAANIDTVFLVNALDSVVNVRRIERYLLATWASGARPVVLLNKADLVDDPAPAIAALATVAPQVPVHAVSGHSRLGFKALAPYLQPGQTIAFLGPSGVGKSTLINRLMRRAVQDTQAVREGDRKGLHTTTQRELLVTPDGVIVIDTPGMREIQPWEAEGRVREAFADVAEVAARCRFRDCSHTVEPGCAIVAALGDGSLDLDRWQSFQRMLAAARHDEARGDRQVARATKTRWKQVTKQLRQRVRAKAGEE